MLTRFGLLVVVLSVIAILSSRREAFGSSFCRRCCPRTPTKASATTLGRSAPPRCFLQRPPCVRCPTLCFLQGRPTGNKQHEVLTPVNNCHCTQPFLASILTGFWRGRVVRDALLVLVVLFLSDDPLRRSRATRRQPRVCRGQRRSQLAVRARVAVGHQHLHGTSLLLLHHEVPAVHLCCFHLSSLAPLLAPQNKAAARLRLPPTPWDRCASFFWSQGYVLTSSDIPTLPYPTLPYPTLPCPALPCPGRG